MEWNKKREIYLNLDLGDYEATVDNVRSDAVHEIYGHGILDAGGGKTKGGSHYKAYEAQMDNKNWDNTTKAFRKETTRQYWNHYNYETGKKTLPNNYYQEYIKYHK